MFNYPKGASCSDALEKTYYVPLRENTPTMECQQSLIFTDTRSGIKLSKKYKKYIMEINSKKSLESQENTFCVGKLEMFSIISISRAKRHTYLLAEMSNRKREAKKWFLLVFYFFLLFFIFRVKNFIQIIFYFLIISKTMGDMMVLSYGSPAYCDVILGGAP